MLPVDFELLKMLAPALLLGAALIMFLWSKVEHPLKTIYLASNSEEAFTKLKAEIRKRGFEKLEENEKARRIRIKGILKIIDVILYRCWSKEIIFQVIDERPGVKLTVTCKPSPFRIAASPKNSNYFSRESFERFLDELAEEKGSGVFS